MADRVTDALTDAVDRGLEHGPGPDHSWRSRPAHRRWCEQQFTRLVEFVSDSACPVGGFDYLGADGLPLPGREPTLLLTARMTHVAALGSVLGVPGSEHLLRHGVWSLSEPFLDDVHGGWFGSLGGQGRKTSYEHVHVLLAAASALVAERHGAKCGDVGTLALRAVEAVEQRFWRAEEGAVCESWSADWEDPEAYRGANANMHAVEAFLAIGDALDDDVWHERALLICERLVNRHARARAWLLPEHFDAHWRELPEYNSESPHDPFRPYGATYGHSLEWARLLCGLHASPRVQTPGWVLEAAQALALRALAGWGQDGRDGLVYTVDWDGRPISTVRLHWPVCEGIQAVSSLHVMTGDREWEGWYRRLWDHATAYFVEPSGSWINELDDAMHEGFDVWPGRPDVYHAAGACLAPLFPPWPFATAAAGRA